MFFIFLSFIAFMIDIFIRLNAPYLLIMLDPLLKKFNLSFLKKIDFKDDFSIIESGFSGFFIFFTFFLLSIFESILIYYYFSNINENKGLIKRIAPFFSILMIIDIFILFLNHNIFLNLILSIFIMVLNVTISIMISMTRSYLQAKKRLFLSVPMEVFLVYNLLSFFSQILEISINNQVVTSFLIFIFLLILSLVLVSLSMLELHSPFVILFFIVYIIGILFYQAERVEQVYKSTIITSSLIFLFALTMFIKIKIKFIFKDARHRI